VVFIQFAHKSALLFLIAIVLAVLPVPASDIPGEGDCLPAMIPSVQSGSVSLSSYDFCAPGSSTNPWIISLGATGLDLVLLFAPTAAEDDTSIPTYLQITLTDSGPFPWSGVSFDLQTEAGGSGSVSFAADATPPPESTEFFNAQSLDSGNGLYFSGGIVLPGQSGNFDLPITDTNISQTGPSFTLEVEPTAVPEAPSSWIALAGMALILLGAILTVRGGARGPQTGDLGGLRRILALP
jgi:hypothetical protein